MSELHPPVVHFAVALTITGVLFDILGFLLNKESLKTAGFWVFLAGVFAVWGAMLSGEVAEESVEEVVKILGAESLLETHETLGKTLPWIFTILALLRFYLHIKPSKKLFGIYLILALVGIGLIGYQGRLGGKMVYEHGVGVKPLMEKAHTYEK